MSYTSLQKRSSVVAIGAAFIDRLPHPVREKSSEPFSPTSCSLVPYQKTTRFWYGFALH